MYTVNNNENTIIIKNSKFISCIYYVRDEVEVKNKLLEIRDRYPDATHYCYAYIIDSVRKESDDGEPSGTAGIPILQVLDKNNLNYVLCIVVRYFGKIKLGAGGLVRAYTKSVTLCLENNIKILKKGYRIIIKFPYSSLKNVDYILRNTKIINKEFDNIIIYEMIVDEDVYNNICNSNYIDNISLLEEGFFTF